METIESDEMDGFVRSAQDMANAAGAHIRQANLSPFSSEIKYDGSPVTEVDKKTEDIIREIITRQHPNHGIVGEERQALNPDAEFTWVIDPIDGTLAFLAGIPVFGTLIALLKHGSPVLGVVDMTATSERWIGQQGKPTLKNKSVVKVSDCTTLSKALLSTSNPDFYNNSDYGLFEKMKSAVSQTVYGGSCMAYAQIATGRIDVGIDAQFDIHDYLPLVPVIEGAGGCISDWKGNTLTQKSGITNILACANPDLHRQALRILQNSKE